MRTRTTTALTAAALLATLTACGTTPDEVTPAAGPKVSTSPTLTDEQRASIRAAAGIPDTTPDQEAAFVAALNAIDKDIAHGKPDKAASRGRSQCQTIHDWPKDESKQIDTATRRFTSPTHPEGRTLEVAKKINEAAHHHLCPDF
ncbi:hypothetical protein ACFXOI_29440 [Streptomyces bacillaris]|uniref:hypothetical protein n=1 Tax=Streptomyces TaxID=1883 RepID=UPI00200CE857|nr:hypothetical protein [Streptomyces sp. HNA39]UQA34808.1 hypothetical protein KRR37_14455 [Streptomyces sp. HNA39]